MVSLEPASEVLLWQWRPDYSFEDRRGSFLRELDGRELLSAWRLEGRAVGALLNDKEAEVSATREYAVCSTRMTRLPDSAWQAVEVLGQVFDPDTNYAQLAHQYIVPLNMSYDEARVQLGARLWPSGFQALGGTDFALLFDGRSAIGDRNYKIEFGVVEAQELPDRLLHRRGRGPLALAGVEHLPPASIDNPPDVSVFLDVTWRLSAAQLEETGHVCPSRGLVDDLVREEQTLVARVLKSVGVQADPGTREEGRP